MNQLPPIHTVKNHVDQFSLPNQPKLTKSCPAFLSELTPILDAIDTFDTNIDNILSN